MPKDTYYEHASVFCEKCASPNATHVLAINAEQTDTPQHCDKCGVFLENPLTNDGVDYVIDSITYYADDELTETETLWLDHYRSVINDRMENKSLDNLFGEVNKNSTRNIGLRWTEKDTIRDAERNEWIHHICDCDDGYYTDEFEHDYYIGKVYFSCEGFISVIEMNDSDVACVAEHGKQHPGHAKDSADYIARILAESEYEYRQTEHRAMQCANDLVFANNMRRKAHQIIRECDAAETGLKSLMESLDNTGRDSTAINDALRVIHNYRKEADDLIGKSKREREVVMEKIKEEKPEELTGNHYAPGFKELMSSCVVAWREGWSEGVSWARQ